MRLVVDPDGGSIRLQEPQFGVIGAPILDRRLERRSMTLPVVGMDPFVKLGGRTGGEAEKLIGCFGAQDMARGEVPLLSRRATNAEG